MAAGNAEVPPWKRGQTRADIGGKRVSLADSRHPEATITNAFLSQYCPDLSCAASLGKAIEEHNVTLSALRSMSEMGLTELGCSSAIEQAQQRITGRILRDCFLDVVNGQLLQRV